MEFTLLEHSQLFFKNLVLGSSGAKKSIYEYMEEGKVDRVLRMLSDREEDIDKALKNAAKAAELIIAGDVNEAMNRFN